MNVKYIAIPILVTVLLGTTSAYAETFTVEMTKNGFSTNSLSVNKGDSVTFVNTHVKSNGNLEPHAISDPFAVPYTIQSYWILDNSGPSHTFDFKTCNANIDYVFHDRSMTVYPMFVKCGYQTASTVATPEIVKPVIVTSTPKVNTVLDATEQELTTKLTASLEREGILNNEIIKLKDALSVVQHKITQLNQTVVTLQSDESILQTELLTVTEERDYFEKQWVNWKGIAMEQLKVMVNVLGIKN